MMQMVFWALAAWFAVSAAAAVHVSPTNEKIQYTGRVNFSILSVCALCTPACRLPPILRVRGWR